MGSRNPHEKQHDMCKLVYYNNNDFSFGEPGGKKKDLQKKAFDESVVLRLGPAFTMLSHGIRFAHTRIVVTVVVVVVVVIVVAGRWWSHWSPGCHGLALLSLLFLADLKLRRIFQFSSLTLWLCACACVRACVVDETVLVIEEERTKRRGHCKLSCAPFLQRS